jgi:hypothetical protein
MTRIENVQKVQNFVAWLACRHHKTHKNQYLDFKTHQYLRGILLDNSPYQVDKKSTQSGHTEIATVRVIAKAVQGLRVFWVWPNDTLLTQYVQERWNKSIHYTPYYQIICKPENDKATDSVHGKDIGKGNVFLVTSNTETAFTSYPADMVDIEEMDECDPENIKMARERLDHSEHRLQYKRGNPKFNGMGIDAEFEETDQKEWGIKCECGETVFLDWFKHVVRQVDKGKYEIIDQDYDPASGRDINPICHKCNRPVWRKSNGLWVPMFPGRQKSGRHTSKLFSGTSPLVEIHNNFTDGLKDDTKMQRFYNADLGLAYTAEGSKLTEQSIFECIEDYAPGPEKGLTVAGIDVGKHYHYVIKRLLPDGTFKTLCIDKTLDTDTLINNLRGYGIKVVVIDADPETRESKKIASNFKVGFLCRFRNILVDKVDVVNKILTAQRTPALDAVKEAILTKTIKYPNNLKSQTEFLKHMTVSVRAFDEKRNVYEWVHGSQPDHYFLATAYCLIAKRLILLLNR